VAALTAPSPDPPTTTFAVPGGGSVAGQAGDRRTGSRRSGRSITLAGSACSCDLPGVGPSPCSPPAAPGAGGEMQLAPSLGHDGTWWPWPAQRLPVGDGKDSRASRCQGFWHTLPTTAIRDTAAALGTRQQKSLVSARLHQGEGRGSLSPSPNPIPSARPGSRSHTAGTLPLHRIPAPREAAGGHERSHPAQTSELLHKERGAEPEQPFPTHPDTWLRVIKAWPRRLSVRPYPGRSGGTENTKGGFSPISSGNEAG